MKKEFRVIDGKLVTGHINREGNFVDVRPVRVRAPYHVYDDNLNSIMVYLYTTKDVIIKDCPNVKYFGYSYHAEAEISGRSATEVTQLRIKVGEMTVEVPVKILLRKRPDYEKQIELNKMHRQNWCIVRAKLDLLLPELLNQLADKYLQEQPKQARRYSSGRNNLDVTQDLYKLMESLTVVVLDDHEYHYIGCLANQPELLRKIPEEVKNLLARKIQERRNKRVGQQ